MRALALLLLIGCVPSLAATARGDEPPPAQHQYELGARIRGVWVTPQMLSAFVRTTSQLSSFSGGAEFVYRKRTYDVVTSLDLTFLALTDANFLGVGRDPAQDTHWVTFGGFGQLKMLSADVSIIGHHPLTRWLEVRYGAGLGLGLVLGDVRTINNGRQCTEANALDPSRCYPHTPDGSVDIPLDQPDAAAKLKATEQPGLNDLADEPHYHVTSDKPPVMVVINLQVGLRFYVQRHLAFDLDLGFRDAIFFGGGFHALW